MKRIWYFLRVVFFYLLLSNFCYLGFAAEDLTVVARVDKTEVRTDQTLRFSVTITGPLRKAPKVKLTALDGFQILSSGTSQEFQLHKGRRRQAMTLTYRLAPTTPGTYTLGPVEVEVEGQIYETQPIEVTVVHRGLGPKSAPELEPFRDPELEEGFIL